MATVEEVKLIRQFGADVTERLREIATVRRGLGGGQDYLISVMPLTLSPREPMLAETVLQLTGDLADGTPRLSFTLQRDGTIIKAVTTGRAGMGGIHEEVVTQSLQRIEADVDAWFEQVLSHQGNGAVRV